MHQIVEPVHSPGTVDVWQLFGLFEGGPVPCTGPPSFVFLAASPSTRRVILEDGYSYADGTATVRLVGPVADDGLGVYAAANLSAEGMEALSAEERAVARETLKRAKHDPEGPNRLFRGNAAKIVLDVLKLS